MAQVVPGRLPSELRGVVSGIVSREIGQSFLVPRDEYERSLASSILNASQEDFEVALEEVALSPEWSASRHWVFGGLGTGGADPLPDAPPFDFHMASLALGRWIGVYVEARDTWDAVALLLNEERSTPSSPPANISDSAVASFLALLGRARGVTLAEFTYMTEFPRPMRIVTRKWLHAMAAELAIGLAVMKRARLTDWLAKSLATATRDGWSATEDGIHGLFTLNRGEVVSAVDSGLKRLEFFKAITDRAAE